MNTGTLDVVVINRLDYNNLVALAKSVPERREIATMQNDEFLRVVKTIKADMNLYSLWKHDDERQHFIIITRDEVVSVMGKEIEELKKRLSKRRWYQFWK